MARFHGTASQDLNEAAHDDCQHAAMTVKLSDLYHPKYGLFVSNDVK